MKPDNYCQRTQYIGIILEDSPNCDDRIPGYTDVEIPATIQELADKYTEGGGDREDLIKAVGEHE